MASVDLKASLRAFPYIGPSTSVLGSNGIVVADRPPPISPVPPSPIPGGVIPGGSTTPPSKPANTIPADQWNRIELKQIDVDIVSKSLGKTLSTLDKVVKFLSPILKILELYISSFNSFAKLLSSAIDSIQKVLSRYESNLGNAGIFMNIIIPPAFLPNAKGNFNIARLYSGGFQGFLNRMDTSLYDVNDPNRPDFPNSADVVGGAIILVDTVGLNEFFRAWMQVMNLLDLNKLFNIQMTPLPPRNIRGRSGYFDDGTGKQKFGIELEWDAPGVPASAFKVSRSVAPGGEIKHVEDIPTSIAGLIKAIKKMLATHKAEWPTKIDRVYVDPDFKGPHKVLANPATGGGSYVDYNIPGLDSSGKHVDTGAYLDPKKPFIPDHQRYYYVVQSIATPLIAIPAVPFGIEGPQSREIRVTAKTCENSFQTANVIEHEDGSFELLSAGFSLQNKWSSVRLNLIVPWVPETIKFFNVLIESLQGMLNDASDSFVAFLKQLTDKIQNYITTLRIIQTLVTQLKKFIIGESVAFLWVPPTTGGTKKFVQRVRSAKLPAGQRSFSGPAGITAGIVMMFGYSIAGLNTLSDSDKAKFKTQFDVVSKSFKFLVSLLTKGS